MSRVAKLATVTSEANRETRVGGFVQPDLFSVIRPAWIVSCTRSGFDAAAIGWSKNLFNPRRQHDDRKFTRIFRTRNHASPGPQTEHQAGLSNGVNKPAATDLATAVKQQTAALAETVTDASKDVAHQAGKQISAVAAQAKDQFSTVVGQAKGDLKMRVDARAHQAAAGLQTLANQLSAMAQGRPNEAGHVAALSATHNLICPSPLGDDMSTRTATTSNDPTRVCHSRIRLVRRLATLRSTPQCPNRATVTRLASAVTFPLTNVSGSASLSA